MNPRVGNVFPIIMGEEIRSLAVDKIQLSMIGRKMRIYFKNGTSPDSAAAAASAIKSAYHLGEVAYDINAKREISDKNIMIYDPETNPETAAEVYDAPRKRVLGRANVVDMLYGKPIHDEITAIASINENSGRVTFSGRVFAVDEREIASKKSEKNFHLVTMDITDNTDSISVKMFVAKTEGDETFKALYTPIKDGVKSGNFHLVCRGQAQYDDYSGEVTVIARDLAEVAPPPPRMDRAAKKRVELHLHTQMSAMDAVSSVSDLVKRAVKWGHKAMAVTDHGVVQAYPDAMHASDNNQKIKILYGMEGYLVDDEKSIVYGASDETIDSPFVVFDIETTGLNNKTNGVTEIGAVKVENGIITDKWSTFVDPERDIPENIQALTGISNDMVKGAETISQILPKFKEFCRGCVLVAHNADFDMGFMKQKAKESGMDFSFPYLDTMMLARCMFPSLHNYKLDTLTNHLNVILENHHRAVDDAKATAEAFVKMIEQLKSEGKNKLTDLNGCYDMRGAAKKNRAFHIIMLAKNERGIRNLYEMISQSQLRYVFRTTPRIPKSLIRQKREGLILGSACEAGELFRAVVDGKSEEEIKEIVDFYDYLEIQPIGNNAYMKYTEDFPHVNTDEDLRELNREIVRLGEKYNKPVCATCDVHFMDPEGADYRKILMNFKGFKDAEHQPPLYFRTTEEMLEEFSYLGREKAYEVVVENTNKIADMIEDVRPIPKKKCPPVVEGAKDDIVNDSLKRAKEIYGDPLPELIQTRLDKELYSITTYGFSVMYKIAQELVRKSLSDGYLVGSRGSVGSSFVAYLSGITEVNSLPAHYICPNCKNVEFIESDTGISGCDLPDKNCPKCGTKYNKDGHDIPFETFLGFAGDKEPDIDLNFSGEYQPVIHKYTETFFGEGFVFRAGTIGTVAEKTALGYVRKYIEKTGIKLRNAEMRRLAQGCVGVKRTSGQHPGGIIVVPYTNNIHEFCPVQHPADDPSSTIVTTHFDYHSIDTNLLKLDELGHDDPTVIRMLEDLTGVNAKEIPLDDKETLSLFTSNKALKLKEDIGTELGSYGIPEFGTKFVRQMLADTKPTAFSELVRISGLSHGTDVWLNNAQDLIRQGLADLSHSICTRDDIMLYLIAMGVEASHSFKIMESVRKGKGLKPEDEEAMRAANVPEWYLDSCKKIKYMFPKAHAVAYVTMAFRIAYFKVHYPEAFYIAYFSVRADDFDALMMAKGLEHARGALAELKLKKKDNTISQKEENLIPILEICIEMYARGINFADIDLYKSHATDFLLTDEGILPPLNAIPGLGENAAKAITEARGDGPFKTVEDLRLRSGITKTNIDVLEQMGCFRELPDADQVAFWD